jgi:hypothetical protein
VTLPKGWTTRLPEAADLPDLVALRIADRTPYTGEVGVDEAAVESEVVGQASWTRRQQVLCDPDGRVRGWVSVQDRAAGRTMVSVWLEHDLADGDRIAEELYAWADDEGRAIAHLRGLEQTRMDASPFAEDADQTRWLAAAGYTCRRCATACRYDGWPSTRTTCPSPPTCRSCT